MIQLKKNTKAKLVKCYRTLILWLHKIIPNGSDIILQNVMDTHGI